MHLSLLWATVCVRVCVCARVCMRMYMHTQATCVLRKRSVTGILEQRNKSERCSQKSNILHTPPATTVAPCVTPPPPPAPVFTWRTCTQSTTRLKLARSTRRCGFHHRKQVAFRQDPTDDQPPNPPELANCQNDCNSDVRHWLWMTTHSRLHKTTTRC